MRTPPGTIAYISRSSQPWSSIGQRACSFAVIALSLLCTASIGAQAAHTSHAALTPVALRVSGLETPFGLDEQKPFFGWHLQTSDPAQHDVMQSAYRVFVASSPALLARNRADIWDSGRSQSRDFVHVTYAGKPLQSHTTYFWKVCVLDGAGDPAGCSLPSHWTTALLHPQDWVAKWIAARPDGPLEPQAREGRGEQHRASEELPLFRHSVSLDKSVRQAIVYVSGLGQYELHLNGHAVTDAVMTPGWTNYRKKVLYDSYDVTDRLRMGQNTLGVMLGNGMYNVPGLEGRYTKFIGSFGNPKMILQMHITFADGTRQVVASDRTWQTAPGPIMLSSIYGGEDNDARREPQGWDAPTPASSSPLTSYPLSSSLLWSNALEVASPGGSGSPGDSLASLLIPPMKVMQVIEPIRQSDPRPGTRIYDLGQNFSGWPDIKVKGHAGDTIRLLAGELLDAGGEVTQRSAAASKSNPVLFTYTLRGGAPETWHPRFAYYGFRYVQVEMLPAHDGAAPPEVLSLTGDFVHDDASVDGHFHSSAPLLNSIHHLIDQAILSNLASVITDCPTREKLGWLEQTYLNGSSIMYNYGVEQLYRKLANDMSESQLPDGMVPSIAPEYVAFVDKSGAGTSFRDSPEWGSAIILSSWEAYRFYGDLESLAAHYESMVRYAAWLQSRSVHGLLTFGLGDWYDIGPRSPGESQLTGKGLTATAIFYQDLVTLAQIATLLNKPAEAKQFASQAEEIKLAFNQAFYHASTATYDRGSQTANAMPLFLGLVPEQDRPAVLASLIADIRAHGNHVTAGDIGFHYVVGALSQSGRSDVLYDMVTRTDSPSYGYQLSKGATALTEAWDTNPNSSQNHFMLGHAEEWFFRGLAGIDLDLSRPEKEQIRLQPALSSGAPGASATVDSVLGTIRSSWQRSGNVWSAEFTIPAGTHAAILLPTGAVSIDASAHKTAGEGETSNHTDSSTEEWRTGSGTYRFTGRF